MKLNDEKLFNDFMELLNKYTKLSCSIMNIPTTNIKDLWRDYHPNLILKAMINDLIEGTEAQIKNLKIKTLDDVKNTQKDIVVFDKFEEHFKPYKKDFITKYIYDAPIICQMDTKAKLVAERLFDSFNKNYKQLPYATRKKCEADNIRKYAKKRLDDGYYITPTRIIANYIAGMTDRYALENYKRMFD